MATQYIEDPETKERIPFEWNKAEPPTSKDVQSLFQSVKKSKLPTVDEAFGMRNVPALKPSQELAPPDLESPEYKKASTLTPDEETTASKGRGIVYPLVGGAVGSAAIPFIGPWGPALGYAAGRQAADLTDISKGRPTEKSTTQEIAEGLGAPLPQEGVTGKVVEQGIKAAQDIGVGKALEVGGKLAGKGAGMVAKKIPIIKGLPWIRDFPEYKIPQRFSKSAKNVLNAPQDFTPGEIKASPSGRMPRGGEVVAKQQKDIADQAWAKFKGNKTPSWSKMNLNNLDKEIIDFTEPGDRGAFNQLDFKEKEIILNEIKNIDSNIHPQMRAGRTQVSARDVGHPERMEGNITRPASMDEMTSERLRIGDLKHKAYQDGNGKLAKAYGEMQEMFDRSIKEHLSPQGVKDFNNALRISTRKHILTNVFGEGAEKSPGEYDWKKVHDRLRSYPAAYLEKYFPEEVGHMWKIRDATTFQIYINDHPAKAFATTLTALGIGGGIVGGGLHFLNR